MGAEYEPTERRPITSRERTTSKRLAAWVARRGLTPNTISVLGMVMALAAGIALALTSAAGAPERLLWILGAVLVQLRLLANMIDGMVAVATGAASRLGEIFNEVPDRVSDTAILVGLGYAVGGVPWLGYVAALLAMFGAYVRASGKVAGGSQQYGGLLPKPQRMFLVTLVCLYCGLAPAGWQPQVWDAPAMGVAGAGLVVIAAGSLVTAIQRLRRIAAELADPS